MSERRQLRLELGEFVVFDDVGPVFEYPVPPGLLTVLGDSEQLGDVGERFAGSVEQAADDVSLVCGGGVDERIEFVDSFPDRYRIEARGTRRLGSFDAQHLSGGEREFVALRPRLDVVRGSRPRSVAGSMAGDAV